MIWETKEDRSLQAHRKSYKTTAIIIVGCIWYLIFKANHRILIARKENSAAVRVLKAIRQHYRSAKMKALYYRLTGIEDFTLVEDKDSRIVLPTKTTVTPEGSIECMGIGGAVTGSHYDHIHTDDIITIKDRVSRAEREHTANFIRELRNIIEFGCPITHTGTPWHPMDGHTLLPKPIKYPLGTLNLAEMTPEEIDNIRRTTTRSLFSANYLLEHVADEDRIFVDAQFAKEMIDNYIPKAQIDAGYKGKDWTAMTLMQERDDGYIYAVGFAWEPSIMDLFGKIRSILERYKAGTLYMESNADKGFSAKEIRDFHPAVSEYHEKRNKHIKIVGHLKKHWERIRWLPETMPEYLNQILDYAEGEDPDDAPDSAASLLGEIIGHDVIIESFSSGDVDYWNEER